MGLRVVAVVVVLAAVPACFAEDTLDSPCSERSRSPEVLVPGQLNAITIELSCGDESLAQWSLHAPTTGIGPPSGGAALTADRPSGELTLTGMYMVESWHDLRALEISAIDTRGVRDDLLILDWSSSP